MYLLHQKLIVVRQNKLTTAKQNKLITARQKKYTGVNRHASDTRIGLMDSTVPIEAMLGSGKE